MENDKLVRLSDVIETIENQCSDGNMWGNENLTLIDASKTIDELSDIPAVDAVEVCRCRECRHRYYYEEDGIAPVCTASMAYVNTPDDWFCKDGQRREEEHNAAD